MDLPTALLALVAAFVVGAVLAAAVVRTVYAGVVATARAELAAERRATGGARDAFAAVSQEALERAQSSFLNLAGAALDRQRDAARGDLDARRQSVEHLVAPLHDSLGQVQSQLSALERSRTQAEAALAEQVRALSGSSERLRTETATLVTALRSPSTRGRWGEVQLRRVVEMAGMVAHCDFVEQASVAGDEGRRRPDLVVSLPGGGTVVVDSKVPLAAWLAALECDDDASRRVQMLGHARQLRAHVDALARKAYWRQFAPSPDFVVLFVPGDAILSSALEAQPDLWEHAAACSVLLATPMTLIGLLRAVATGWRQEAMAADAQQVCDLGKQLHTRLATLVGHVDKLGRALDGAVSAYNDSVGALEGRVLVSARRFTDLQVTEAPLPGPRQVERAARRLPGAAEEEVA